MILFLVIALILVLPSWALSPLGCFKRLEAMEYHSAIVYGDRLLRSGNREYGTYLCIGRAHFELRNYNLAVSYLERAQQRAKNDIEKVLSAFYMGRAYEGLGDYVRAINVYKGVLPLAEALNQGISLSLMFQLAEAYEKINNLDEALRLYTSMESKTLSDREKLRVVEKMGDIMAKKQDYSLAVKAYDAALLLASSVNDILALSRINAKLGDINLEMKNVDTAVEQYEQAISYIKSAGNKRVEASLYERLALAYMMKDDFKEAIVAYEKAVDLYRTLRDTSNALRAQERLEVLRRFMELRREL